MNQDVLARLRSVDPVRRIDLARTDTGALDALREGIIMTDRTPATTSTVRRLGRRGTLAVGLSFVLVGGGAAYAAYQQFSGGIVDGLNCQSVWNQDTDSADGPPLSGDPVADCVTYRAQAGLARISDPVAFTYQAMVFVTPRDQVPEGATLLGILDPQAAAVRELTANSRDLVDGGRSSCMSPGDAAAHAKADLARLGLSGWSVVIDDAVLTAVNKQSCSDTAVDVATTTVTVLPERMPDPADLAAQAGSGLTSALRSGITDACVGIDEARVIADAALADLPHWPTTSVVDETATCSRVDLETGGSIQVTVYGPTNPTP